MRFIIAVTGTLLGYLAVFLYMQANGIDASGMPFWWAIARLWLFIENYWRQGLGLIILGWMWVEFRPWISDLRREAQFRREWEVALARHLAEAKPDPVPIKRAEEAAKREKAQAEAARIAEEKQQRSAEDAAQAALDDFL